MDTRIDPFDQIRRAIALPNVSMSSDYDLSPGILAKLPKGRKLRPASVLIPLILRKDEIQVILTRRSGNLSNHPGQVAFPGGKVDPQDKNARDAALREAFEEIGLPRENVDILGEIDTHETVTAFSVIPVLARIHTDFLPVPEPGEVAEIFAVPLEFLMRLDNFQTHHRKWSGQERAYLAIPYGPHFIWGATANIIKGLAMRMATV